MRGRFKLCPEPVVHFGAVVPSLDTGDSITLPKVSGGPMLFAIARDERTIFVSWDVDWRSFFREAMPVDRQVHLRLLPSIGFEPKTHAVEPMLGNFYVPVSQPRATYRVELGYYTRGRGWKSVVFSDPIAMTADAPSENRQVDVATVPFHINFQKLVDLLRLTNGESPVTALSRFEDRVRAMAEQDIDVAPSHREVLSALNISTHDLHNGGVSFAKMPDELRVRKCSEAIRGLGATSSTSGFGAGMSSQ